MNQNLTPWHEPAPETRCLHSPDPPTAEEIASCPEIIVRRCSCCGRELWWSQGGWIEL